MVVSRNRQMVEIFLMIMAMIVNNKTKVAPENGIAQPKYDKFRSLRDEG
jgi:hypothetical protein